MLGSDFWRLEAELGPEWRPPVGSGRLSEGGSRQEKLRLTFSSRREDEEEEEEEEGTAEEEVGINNVGVGVGSAGIWTAADVVEDVVEEEEEERTSIVGMLETDDDGGEGREDGEGGRMTARATSGMGMRGVVSDAYERREAGEERRVGKECRSRWSPYH